MSNTETGPTARTERTITTEDLAAVFDRCDHCGTITTRGGDHRCRSHFKNNIRKLGNFQADTDEGKSIRRALDPGIPDGLDQTVLIPDGGHSSVAFHLPKRGPDGEILRDDGGHPIPRCPVSLKKKSVGRYDGRARSFDHHWTTTDRLSAYRMWDFPCAACFDMNTRFTKALQNGETPEALMEEGDRRRAEYIADGERP